MKKSTIKTITLMLIALLACIIFTSCSMTTKEPITDKRLLGTWQLGPELDKDEELNETDKAHAYGKSITLTITEDGKMDSETEYFIRNMAGTETETAWTPNIKKPAELKHYEISQFSSWWLSIRDRTEVKSYRPDYKIEDNKLTITSEEEPKTSWTFTKVK